MAEGEHLVVVGAGVSGLTTAVVLAEAGMAVRVVADEVPGVTSLAAGAMWGPYLVEPKEKVDHWSRCSLDVFQRLAVEPDVTGVRLTSGIEASRHSEDPPEWATTLPGFRPVGCGELPAGFASGYRFTVPLINMPTYLAYLQGRLLAAGGTITRGSLRSLAEAGPASAVVNCSGLRAGSLVPDPALRPIRGQHVVVANPGLTEFFSEDTGLSPDLLCIYPHGDIVVLGGTAIDGHHDPAEDEVAAAAILSRCVAVEPRLAGVRILAHRVGFRPTRARVRVEADRLPSGIRLVHNYGHGGAGVTLSWGCAAEVRRLLADS
ncbi:FAD-dependent oxidoreductase [Streptomyces sp. AK02-01A]|uniref:FAD-dependent oxidoreductase n=1 Tax=Streptomyces sp. AK02-01A TaxID=3028648 RepID=UPI0029B4636D|nr:FAD-dependent oxidoreductase [Streptomyces sp. AK02-01A]MDX3850308.1 FAD-dependent oxidoreductase [Streptomyces sp. AK02-01A]